MYVLCFMSSYSNYITELAEFQVNKMQMVNKRKQRVDK